LRVGILICVAFGCAAFAGDAVAQYYPSGPYSYPGGRAAPPPDYDIDPDYAGPPPGLIRRPPAAVPNQYDPSYDRQALPPPGVMGSVREPYYDPPSPSYNRQPLPPPGVTGSVRDPYYDPQSPSYNRQPLPPPGSVRDAYPYDPRQPLPPPGAMREPAYEDQFTGRPPIPRDNGAYTPPPQYGWEPARPPAELPGGAPDAAGRGLANPNGPVDLTPQRGGVYASLPPDYRPEEGEPKELPPHLRRQLVDYPTTEPTGTIVIDTPNTYLYLVLGNGKAMRYGIGVGRDGFTWAGRERVSKMAEWPDWHPPKEMIERQPYLPRFMAGGASNPLGARALYLGNTLYRIHGTNQPSTIGTFVSSGCIRLINEDIEDLYGRVNVGTRVVVLTGKAAARTTPAAATR
jgi:lipoprotein-anchoring transpeptidase ErfK/SrfK